MAIPLMAVVGGTMALQALGISAQNKQAQRNAETKAKALYRNFGIQIGQLQDTANEVNKQIGLELTNVQLEGMKSQATTANTIVEREISGKTAERIVEQSAMNKLMFANQLKQKAESNMVDIGKQMLSAKYQYESNMMDVAINQINQSTTGINAVASIASTGASTYLSGKGAGLV